MAEKEHVGPGGEELDAVAEIEAGVEKPTTDASPAGAIVNSVSCATQATLTPEYKKKDPKSFLYTWSPYPLGNGK